MSNPKVFEFAKEVGMTPLALMDKIREWQIPVKSHMAELSPDVLEQIKVKLGGGGDSASEAKPKKKAAVARKKPVAKKTAADLAAAEADAVKSPVIRRKTKEEKEEAVEEAKAQVIAKAEAEAEAVADAAAVEEEAAPKVTRIVSKIAPAVEAEPEQVAAPAAVETPVVEEKVTKVKSKKSEVAPEVEAKSAPEVQAPVQAAPAAPVVARKKEVVVGTSGIASSSTPASAPKRNIIGRMDLSRVQSQAPPRPGGGGFQGGDRPSSGGGASASYTGPRPGGFNRPTGGAPTRNIRTGFVASAPAELPPPGSEDFRARDVDKRNKKFGPGAGPVAALGAPGAALAAKGEREGVVQVFNAVEFRKREMVFQPKKKKGFLDRTGMKTQITTPAAHKRIIKVAGPMKVADVAAEMGLKAPQLMKVLMQNGVMGNLHTMLDFDTIALIAPEFKWEAQNTFKTAQEVLDATAFGNLEAVSITRPPVVTVMGHVDHGKTSLLDAIRNAKVASGEAGGITQHIGAYSVKMEDGSFITFLDTPGHEAFTAMRARGANATDIAIIVVAADDGMMPQTQEAVNHAKAAGVPIIVAVNKIDKPGSNPERIKQQLTELEIVPEEWGGTTIFCEVSALQKTGINELLENIRLVAEVQDLKANPERSGTGIVIESKVEKGKGSVATLLIRDGTVSIGQYIVAGSVKGRVRSLMNDRGERVQSMGPGFPVEVLGLDSTPAAGDKFDVVKDEKTAEEVSSLRKEQAHQAAVVPGGKMSLEDLFSKVKSGDVKELPIILKADVHGSLEAVTGMIGKLSTSEVKARIIHSGVGGINESDVLLAHTAKGVVIGFNVRPDGGAQAKAKQNGVDVRSYSIVYELVDDMKKAMSGLLSPVVVEEQMGRAEVRSIFTVPKIGTIAGSFIVDGKIQRNNMIRLVRDGKIVYEGKISSLKRFKDDAKEVATGFECGIGIENFNDVKVGDVMEAYVKKEVSRDLEANA